MPASKPGAAASLWILGMWALEMRPIWSAVGSSWLDTCWPARIEDWCIRGWTRWSTRWSWRSLPPWMILWSFFNPLRAFLLGTAWPPRAPSRFFSSAKALQLFIYQTKHRLTTITVLQRINNCSQELHIPHVLFNMYDPKLQYIQ